MQNEYIVLYKKKLEVIEKKKKLDKVILDRIIDLEVLNTIFRLI